MLNLTIFCSGKHDLKPEYVEATQNLISRIDTEKYRITYGGGSIGLMGTVRDTFKNRGGTIITSNLKQFLEGDGDDYVFDNISDRQSKLIELADLMLVLMGGFGTMYECLEAITKNQIREISKKVVIFNFNHIYDHLLAQIAVLQKEGFIKNSLDEYNIVVLTTVNEVVEYLDKFGSP
jgi:uncharacterized protein (TIGR00730 family)